MQLAPIITRLKTAMPALNNQVEGAISLQNIRESGATISRKAWVVPLKETAGRNLLAAQAVRQRLTTTIGIVVTVRNVRDAHGAAAHDGGLSDIRTELMAALHGWTPSDPYGLFEYAGGELISLQAGVATWIYRFSTEHYQSSV